MQSERKAEGEETATIVRASITRFRKFNETFWGKEFAIYLITVVLFSGGAGVCELGVQWFPCQREPCHSVVLRHVCQKTYDQVECSWVFILFPMCSFCIRQTDRQILVYF